MSDTIKTAVSLNRELFERAEAAAGAMRVSRSRLVALALEEFLRRAENRRLLDQINRAYAAAPDTEERAVLDEIAAEGARVVDGGEW